MYLRKWRTDMSIRDSYMNDVPIGYAADSAFSGILLFELHKEDSYDHHDFVICEEVNGQRKNFRRQTVAYSGERPYIFKRGRRWYLDEIMRTNV